MADIIEVTGLNKRYGEVEAVRGIDFTVEAGNLFAFLGPNGAGKSTTIDILCTLLKPDAGEVIIDGHLLGKEDAAIRQQIGVVFQNGLLDQLLTVEENLTTRGSFYGLTSVKLKQAVTFASETSGVTEYFKRPYGKLSGGQKRRSDIARALVHMPKILFLDEPTTGLDPQTRKSVWSTIRKLQRESGMTVFLTTHYMEEAATADQVCVIDKGVITAQGTPGELREKYSRDRLLMYTEDPQPLLDALDAVGAHGHVRGGRVSVTLNKTTEAIPLINACQPYFDVFEVVLGSMDDAFIAIIGKEDGQ